MQQIDKVIRMPMDAEFFYEFVSHDLTEWWFSFDDLIMNDNVLPLVKDYDVDIFQQLQNGEADYLAIYSDV